MRDIFIFIYPFALCFLFQSCGLLTDDSPGTGTIKVTIDGESYEASDVKGTEYFGFHSSGKISGKTIGLSLGQAPHSGDTLTFVNIKTIASYDICVIYDGNYGLKESGKIIITKKSGSSITGSFYCKIVAGQDTLDFSDGIFEIDFPASR